MKRHDDPQISGNESARREESCRILLAEDDEAMRALLTRFLRNTGYEVTDFADGSDLLDHLATERERANLVISDIRMPGVNGMDVLRDIRERNTHLPMILITAFGDEDTHAKAKQLGAAAVFDKPFDIDELVDKVSTLVPPKQISAY